MLETKVLNKSATSPRSVGKTSINAKLSLLKNKENKNTLQGTKKNKQITTEVKQKAQLS